jgi:hypothetical protein
VSEPLFISFARVRRILAAQRRGNLVGEIMFTSNQAPQSRRGGGTPLVFASTIVKSIACLAIAMLPLFGMTTSVAYACACGCSVFDVGGSLLPQENDHGGRVFFEYWYGDQNTNWVGNSKGSATLNQDKEVKTEWYNVGFQYMFNRDWGVMARLPVVNRDLTTTVGPAGDVETFNTRDIGDLEIMGMYTGFFKDMSTGVIFGLKLPTGPYDAFGLDRDTQIGSGSTDLILGGFHRGLLTGDNAWQYFSQIRAQIPFLFRSALDPQSSFDGNPNPGVPQLYKPGYQADGAIGVLYNNWYNVFGLDKITPLAQFIISHRANDTGDAADPYNSGFDRIMISPGIEFTKVLDEANNRVFKLYVDVEIPIYYRTNAADNGGPLNTGITGGTEGQMIAPYLIKAVASYNF